MTRWARVKVWWNRLLSEWAPWRLREQRGALRRGNDRLDRQNSKLRAENGRLEQIAVDATRVEVARVVMRAFFADRDLATRCLAKIGRMEYMKAALDNTNRDPYVLLELGPFQAGCVMSRPAIAVHGEELVRKQAAESAMERMLDYLEETLGESPGEEHGGRCLAEWLPMYWGRLDTDKGKIRPDFSLKNFWSPPYV